MHCGSKRKKNKKPLSKVDLYSLKEKYRFNEGELIEFKQRFTYLANAQDKLDKETFRENMGLLGLDSGSFLADRIFAVLDADKDGHIKLDEYLKYFDILIHGSQDEKYDLTYRMIDISGNGYFTFDEFKDMIMSMLYTWNSLTGSHYNITQNQKLDIFLDAVYNKFDVDQTGKVTNGNFKSVVSVEPQLLEIFDYFNQGIIDSVQPGTELDEKDLHIIDDLENLHTKLSQLKEYIDGKQEVNSEIYHKEVPPPSYSQVKELKRIETSSPHGELKTPIVSSLDSRIKKTIFFEAFKDDLDKLPALGPMRQKSEIVDSAAHKSSLTGSLVHDFARRRSYQPDYKGIDRENDEVIHTYSTAAKQGKIMDKFKSIEVIYQEGNSHSFSYHNPMYRGESRHPTDLKDVKVDIEFDPNLSYATPSKRADLQSPDFPGGKNRVGFPPKTGDQSLDEPSSPQTVQTVGTQKKPEVFFSQLVPIIDESPRTKKLDLHFKSAPLKPKLLDTANDNPDRGSTVANMSDLRSNANLIESILVTKVPDQQKIIHKNEEFLEIPENTLRPITPARFAIGGKSSMSNLQIHQLQEQLDTLAAETLKIIDEIRNKKRNTLTITNADLHEEQKKATTQNIHKVAKKDRKSNFVSFGHQNWNLVLNMMLGIQTAIKSVVERAENVDTKDFKVKFIFELVPKRTSVTKDSVKICTFFDYAPSVFYELRRLFGIKNSDYLKSIGPEAMLSNLIKGDLSGLSELTSTGKSGSFFYYSADGKYTLKTISRDEFIFFREILKNYYTHLVNNPHTLIIKFFGLHKIKFLKKKSKKEKVYFVIMSNVFHTLKEIHIRYDLKGSTKGRITKDDDPSVAKKDLNMIMNKEKIMLPPELADSFVDIIEKDSKFFEENGILDYSLLMGIHYLTQEEQNNRDAGYTGPRKSLYEAKSLNAKEGVLSSDGTKLYFFGIIDILTHFNTKKKMEYVVKRIAYGKDISAVPPPRYAERFRSFIKNVVDRPKANE